MLSIIIPTLNEDHFLPILLDSIKKQNFNDFEIIVSDAGSKDKTLEIAKENGCKIVKGGPPAVGRNNGARDAKGDMILFLDADVVLPDGFLNSSIKEFKRRNLGIAAFKLIPRENDKLAKFFFDLFYNKSVLLTSKFFPHAAMGILIKKDIFKKLKGFDETVVLAEDHDLARRAQKISEYGIIKSSQIYVSSRRFKKDGWTNTAFKYFLCELHMIFIGPIKSDIFNIFEYKFDHYSDKDYNTNVNSKKEIKLLEKLQKIRKRIIKSIKI